MEKPGLQYERTFLSWWRTLLASVVVTAAIIKVSLPYIPLEWLVIGAVILLLLVFLTSFFMFKSKFHNRNDAVSFYSPPIFIKQLLSILIGISSLVYSLVILSSFI